MTPRPTLMLQYENPKDIHEMCALSLTPREHRAYLRYDFWVLRATFLSMLLPMVHSKLTGVHCGEGSRYRASEIVMCCLMGTRVLLNICIDLSLVNFKKKHASPFSVFRHVIWSLLEHGLPCIGYVMLMYFIFVEHLKPPLDDDDGGAR